MNMEIPVIDPETQIDKGVDNDMKDWYAVHSISLAIPFIDDSEMPDFFTSDVNRHVAEKYPDGPTSDLFAERSWFELNMKAHQERRKVIFRGLGGVTTIEMLKKADTPYDVDYIKKQVSGEDGTPRTRTDWGLGREMPEEVLDMFDIIPPGNAELATNSARTICFYDHGEYFFPVFQFGFQEGNSESHYITAVERVLGIEGKYPSHTKMLDWIRSFKGIDYPLHEFIQEENFDPDKLWDIYWQALGHNPRNIFGGPSAFSKDDGRPVKR